MNTNSAEVLPNTRELIARITTLCGRLEPENLFADGENSREEVDAILADITPRLDALVHTFAACFGFTPDEVDFYMLEEAFRVSARTGLSCMRTMRTRYNRN